jgi:hypothetical protein
MALDWSAEDKKVMSFMHEQKAKHGNDSVIYVR